MSEVQICKLIMKDSVTLELSLKMVNIPKKTFPSKLAVATFTKYWLTFRHTFSPFTNFFRDYACEFSCAQNLSQFSSVKIEHFHFSIHPSPSYSLQYFLAVL